MAGVCCILESVCSLDLGHSVAVSQILCEREWMELKHTSLPLFSWIVNACKCLLGLYVLNTVSPVMMAVNKLNYQSLVLLLGLQFCIFYVSLCLFALVI